MSRVRARPRRIFPLAAALAIVVALASCSGGAHPRAAAKPTITALPRSYVVVYRVVQNGGRHWEVLTVHRPFAGSDLTYDTPFAPGPGDPPATGNVSTDVGLYAVDGAAVRMVSGRQPGPASGDQFLATELGDVVARKLAADTGVVRTVTGRSCRVYRFLEPPAGPVRPLGRGGDHDDLCFDRSGLVLSERWTYHGAVVLERTAANTRTSFGDLAAGVEPAAPSTVGAAPAGQGAGSAAPDPRPDSFLAAPVAPAGYDAAGPPVAFRAPDPQSPKATIASSVVWAFADGARFVTVEAGSGRAGQLPWRPDDTVTSPVTLRGLGRATSAVRSDGAEVRVDLGGGRWVRVKGAMSVRELLAYAQRLTPAGGAAAGR